LIDNLLVSSPEDAQRTTTLEKVTTYLSSIIERHREVASRETRSLDDLIAEALQQPAPRGFADALRHHDGLALIAEVKRKSPSLGPLVANLNPAELSAAYQRGGASCCSVLTDEVSFGGSPEDLALVAQTVPLPILRKDFTVSAFDVADARRMGADAVLLIVAALSDGELREFSALAAQLSLDVLVEVHDEAELERVARHIPNDVVAVAESGIKGSDDAKVLADAGFHAILVGETLVKSPSPEDAARELVGFPRRNEVST
jgi:indole-3-glycerol phosphate synthase